MHFIKTKPFILTLFLLGSSLPAFADGGICIPSTKGGFNVGLDALYLRPNTDNLAYAILTSNQHVGDLAGYDLNNALVDPTYNWGFRAQWGYWFPCTCYDINLSYAHLKTTDRDSIVAPPFTDNTQPAIIVPPFNSDIYSNNFASASSKAEFNLNVIDLDGGWHIDGKTYDIRLFAGLRYAKIDRNLSTTAEPLDDFIFNPNQQFKSCFKGVGPRIGVQGRYGQRCGWGLDADVSVAVLVGQLDSRYQGNVVDFPPIIEHWNIHEAKNSAIPALEAKLGVDYAYRMGYKRDALLVFEGGYQGTGYFNVINTPDDLAANFPFWGDNSVITSATSNVTFNGPYLGVKYYA